MIKILIADDHSIVRRGIAEIISGMENVNLIGEASSGTELLEKLKVTKADMVIMDISMPGKSGIEILKELKVKHSDIKVLILSMHPEEKYGMRMIKAGADGYLSKESASEDLPAAIIKIMGGGKYTSQNLTDQIIDSIGKNHSVESLHSQLSNREYEVFLLLAEGKSVAEIASKLFLSVSTISTYRARILDKMGMKTNADLTYYAIKNKLIE